MKTSYLRVFTRMEKALLIGAIIIVMLTVFVPLMMAVLWSLVSSETPWSYPDVLPQKLNFDRWVEVWKFTAIKKALLNSYMLAPLVAFFAVLLALPTAYALGRFNFRGKTAVQVISLIPMIMPGIAVALFFTQALYSVGFRNQFIGIVMGHVVVTIPFSIRILSSAFQSIPQDIIDAAQDLGAGKVKVFVTAYMPSLRPAVFASFIFVFIKSIEEFNISYILGSPNFTTVPTILFSFLGYNLVRPNAAVVSLILLIPNLILMFGIEKFLRADKMLGTGVKG